MLGAGEYALMPSKEAMPKAEAAAKKALQIDNSLAEPHAALALVKECYDWDWEGAQREYERAIELNPNYATAHHWYAIHLLGMRRYPQAITEARKAESLDPLSLIISTDVGSTLHYARQDDPAIEQLRKALEMDPNFAAAHYTLALCYAQKKRYPEAIAEMKHAIELAGDESTWTVDLAYIYAMAGQRDKTTKILNELKQASKHRFVPATDFVLVYIGLGDKDHAFFWLEKAYASRDSNITGLGYMPELDPLRSDPRFQDLQRRVGLPP
jgi:tetratricopeptide (TPR) repeat protein